MTRRSGVVWSLALLLCAASATVRVSTRPQPARQSGEPPRLVVLLVLDQFSAAYIDLYGRMWTKGFRRLLDEGAVFRNAAYPYGFTVTCAGHSTIGTGAMPATHGMVANSWYDRDQDKTVTCEQDADAAPVVIGPGTTTSRHSAHFMKVPTFADELRRQASRPPNVVSIAVKPRAAIGMAGHGGSGTLVMWQTSSGAWATSTAYASQPWSDADAFVVQHPFADAFGEVWAKLLPDRAYRFVDDDPAEATPTPWTRTFPHTVHSPKGVDDPSFVTTWQRSPWADRFLTDLAINLLQTRRLGREPGTDMLAVSFGALDAVGHQYGPRSHEVQDILVRADENIGRLLDALDRDVGAGRYVVAVSGDHGVTPLPEDIVADGGQGGRFTSLSNVTEQTLQWMFGASKKVGLVDGPQIALTKDALARLKANPADEALFVNVLRSAPGTSKVFRADELASTAPTDDADLRAWRLSYMAGRSGDYVVVPKPNYLFSSTGAGHGSQNAADQRVPLVLYGFDVRKGQYDATASPADIAPTFAALTHVSLPTAQGRVLKEALLSQ